MKGRWIAAALVLVTCLAAPAGAVGFAVGGEDQRENGLEFKEKSGSVTGGAASTIGFAVGGYGVWNFPIVQDDAGAGALYGAKAKIGRLSIFALEPSITWISVGDKDQSEDGLKFTQKGGSIQTYGLNLNIGGFPLVPGPSFYATGGIGSYTLKSDVPYVKDDTRVGYNAGLGIAVKPTPLFDIDLSGRFIVIPLDGGGSRKSVGLFAGLNFYFGV